MQIASLPAPDETWLATLGEDDRLLTAQQTAAVLHKSEGTLEDWRRQGTGPPFHRIGRTPVYLVGELKAWIKRS
jgi:hypothetical protein